MAEEKLLSLKDLLIHEVRDLHSAETQITEALPKMAEKAKDKKLKEAFKEHLEETKEQKRRLEEVMKLLDLKPDGVTCEAMEGLIEEGKELMSHKAEDDVMDAGLISTAQRVEHYEIAAYGSAVNFAKRLGMNDVEKLLKKTLEEEKNADSKLNSIAVERVNEKASKS